MNIPEALLTSLIAQYGLAQENAQAKIPTALSLAIEAIWREFDGQVGAHADASWKADCDLRAEGQKQDVDLAHCARMAGAL